MFLIAFSGKDFISYQAILNPRYSSSFLAKKDYSALTLKPAAFNLVNTLSYLLT